MDLPPTLLTVAGLTPPPAMRGRPLQQLLGPTPPADWPQEVFVQISEDHCGRAVRTRRWKYSVRGLHVTGADPAAETYVEDCLYDLAADPHEQTNLVADPAYAAVRAELAETLKRRMAAAGEAVPVIALTPPKTLSENSQERGPSRVVNVLSGVARHRRVGSGCGDECAALLIRLHRSPGYIRAARPSRPGAQVLARHAVGHVLEERVDAQREGRAEVLDARIEHIGYRGHAHRHRGRICGALRVGAFPQGNLLDAVLDAERTVRARNFHAPPAAEAERRIAALAEQVADAAVGELTLMPLMESIAAAFLRKLGRSTNA